MPSVLFHTPMKSPDAATPSGDRRMAQLFLDAFARTSYTIRCVEAPSSYDGSGDGDRQRALRHECRLAARRIAAESMDDPDADVVLWFSYHVYHKSPDWIGPLLTRHYGLPLMLAEASYSGRRRNGAWALGFAGAYRAIRHAERILCLTERDRHGLKAIREVSALRRFPPFIDMEPFDSVLCHRAACSRRVRDHYGIAADKPILLSVAMMRHGDKLSSYHILGQALAMLSDYPWVLLVAGGGAAEAEVRATLVRAGADRVILCGVVDMAALPDLYAAADVYVWPGVGEAFGMAYLEAQAAGTPVVAWRCGGVGEVVEDGQSGLLAPQGDVVALATQLRLLIENAPHRHEMGLRAAAIVRRRHGLVAASARLADEVDACREAYARRRMIPRRS